MKEFDYEELAKTVCEGLGAAMMSYGALIKNSRNTMLIGKSEHSHHIKMFEFLEQASGMIYFIIGSLDAYDDDEFNMGKLQVRSASLEIIRDASEECISKMRSFTGLGSDPGHTTTKG